MAVKPGGNYAQLVPSKLTQKRVSLRIYSEFYATIKFKEIINFIVIHERGYKTDFVYLTRSNKINLTPNFSSS